jgi:membrane-bound serine protease (ClpP class)
MKVKPQRLAILTVLTVGVWLSVPAQPPGGGVYVLSFQDAIGPATSAYIVDGLDQAIAADASLAIIEMGTPGGLDTAMRDIIQAILRSPVPVASFVYPEGARAASAGTYILMASHIAAMAPSTNTGACTPVEIGGIPGGSSPDDGTGDATPDSDPPQPGTDSVRKAVYDAVAVLRSLAETRGRNADWAESCVRSAASLSARDALERNVIDLIATDRADLMRQLDGRVIDGTRLALPPTILVTVLQPDWRSQLLSVITNPSIAYMLMLLGIYGLIFEGYNPGAIVPGVVGAISLLLALFAFQVLPVNYAGLALILLGLILIVSEFFVPSFGALGMGGIAAFVFGSLILIDTDVPGFEVATSMISAIAFTGALLLAATVWLALRSREHRVVSGIEEMSGMPAEALEDFESDGPVWVHGERWQAHSRVPVRKGQRLRVTRVNGLIVHVEPETTSIEQ